MHFPYLNAAVICSVHLHMNEYLKHLHLNAVPKHLIFQLVPMKCSLGKTHPFRDKQDLAYLFSSQVETINTVTCTHILSK